MIKSAGFKFIVALATVTFAASAAAEVTDSRHDGFTINFERRLPVNPAGAYEALTKEVGKWWIASHTWYGDSQNMYLEAKVGGCLCEVAKQGQTEHLQVIKVEPDKLIRFSGGLGPLQAEGLHGVMDWRLQATEDPNQSILKVYYRVGGYSPNDLSRWAPAVDGVLQQQMDSLKAYLEQ